ncbi:AAC(3) family N-acetyltransferase [Bacillus sp. T3]|uniref:AAC(3) family N-acetyltransferase n=1 Tax=Bacillus sp. T3 TaxID=467262 RepID=UPI0029810186|nr:AAC(3) family N-acetyltransferase [Bacillus sp. T3]
MLQKKVNILLRRLLKVKDNESIEAAIRRKRVKINKTFFKKKITVNDIYSTLINLGINEGDNLMVHASWRDMYNFDGKPEDIIDCLTKILGEEGTLLMPAYGPKRTYFDVENTPSSAGVLSEVFRLQPNTYRSACTHFSVCARGKYAYELTYKHVNSEYGFDTNSPYYLFTNLKHSKVLFIGLGKEPTQISLFHCAGYILKEKLPVLNKLLSHKYKSILVKDGNIFGREMIIRKPGHKNNKRVFKKIFRSIVTKSHVRHSNIDFVVMDAKEGLEKAIDFARKGQYCYSNIGKLSKHFE